MAMGTTSPWKSYDVISDQEGFLSFFLFLFLFISFLNDYNTKTSPTGMQ